MDWFFNFPDMSRSDLREFKKTVDFAFTDFSRSYGADIESFFGWRYYYIFFSIIDPVIKVITISVSPIG